MEFANRRSAKRLPHRFPVGATYVVEGYGGEEGHLRALRRLPGGRRINVPRGGRPPVAAPAIRFQRNAKPQRSQEKILSGRGRKNSPLAPELDDGCKVGSIAPGEAPQPLTLNHPASNPGRVSDWGFLFLKKGNVVLLRT